MAVSQEKNDAEKVIVSGHYVRNHVCDYHISIANYFVFKVAQTGENRKFPSVLVFFKVTLTSQPF